MDLKPFSPAQNKTQKISVANSNTLTALTFPGSTQYVFTAPATNTDIVFIDFSGAGGVATTSTSYPLLPGQKETLSCFGGLNAPTSIANISGSGTQVLYVSAGRGT